MTVYQRDKRDIRKIVIHCSASDNKDHDDISVIKRWHIEERKFADVAYHFFIQKSGNVQQGRRTEVIGAHCEGQNKDSIGICLAGDKEFTPEQFKSLRRLIVELKAQFKIKDNMVFPHNFFNKNKTCPNFNVEEALKIV